MHFVFGLKLNVVKNCYKLVNINFMWSCHHSVFHMLVFPVLPFGLNEGFSNLQMNAFWFYLHVLIPPTNCLSKKSTHREIISFRNKPWRPRDSEIKSAHLLNRKAKQILRGNAGRFLQKWCGPLSVVYMDSSEGCVPYNTTTECNIISMQNNICMSHGHNR